MDGSVPDAKAARTYQAPALHPQEDRRIGDLRLLGLLDSEAEARFDRLTALVAEILQVPTVLISLVDSDRQWFMSRVGFEACESPRETSFCGHAILEQQMMVIEDTRHDDRFRDNPLVTGEPGIRFYAGAVLHGLQGLPVATLCLIDQVPRRFDESQRRQLAAFARLAESELQLRARIDVASSEARHAAMFDQRTGLPTTNLLHDRANQALEAAAQGGGQVLLARVRVPEPDQWQLARFEDDVILTLIRMASERIIGALGAHATVSYAGSSEFLVLLPSCSDHAVAMARFQSLQQALSRPWPIGSESVELTASIGVAVGPAVADNAPRLVMYAGMALREAEAAGEPCVFFDEHTIGHHNRRLQVRDRLRKAIAEGTLQFHFRPIVDVASGEIRSVEALARWDDEELGTVSPAEFIPVAEQAGLMESLTTLLTRRACRAHRTWRDVANLVIPVSINVHGPQLAQTSLADRTLEIVAAHDLEPAAIGLEITEGAYLRTEGPVMDNIRRLSEAGVRLLIDDFGTGYASFGYIKHLPVHTVKLDRELTNDITTRPRDATITHSLITMARELGMDVVAEGVENAEQMSFLRAFRCGKAQGFHLARPLSESAITERLLDQRGRGGGADHRHEDGEDLHAPAHGLPQPGTETLQ